MSLADYTDDPKWRKITMRYTGRCTVCSKLILAGQQGMWSKEAGAKHLGCAGVDDNSSSSSNNNNKEALGSSGRISCAVCGKPAGCQECELQDSCDIPNVSPNCLCHDCSQKGDVMNLYQKSTGSKFPPLLRG